MTKPLRKKITKAEQELAQRVRDVHAIGLPPEVAVLDMWQDIEITRNGEARDHADGKKVDHDTARRKDVFLIIGLPQPSYEAARRLERDIYANRGEDDRGVSLAMVDGSTGRCRQDRMMMAGDRIAEALLKIGVRDQLLLVQLIAPTIQGEQWRQTVHRVTHETNPVSQATVIRSACANLAAGYALIDGAIR